MSIDTVYTQQSSKHIKDIEYTNLVMSIMDAVMTISKQHKQEHTTDFSQLLDLPPCSPSKDTSIYQKEDYHSNQIYSLR